MAKNNIYDEQAVTELQLYVENTGEIYQKDLEPTYKNLAKKQAKDNYDPEKAQVSYYRIANKGANMYKKEFGNSNNVIFTSNDKKEVARRLEKDNRDELNQYL